MITWRMTFWSFDQVSGKMRLFSVTSQDGAHDHVGEWIDDKTLEYSWKRCYERKELEEKISINGVSKDQIEVKETDSSKGKIKLSSTYVFKRKEA